ncbi:aqualysin-1-like [Patiria miniata]|uniref:Subtilisin n=1 Tax=Patiria miniata TaxID=46514 RepID=A0A914B702_PATMI|nr:aqualysin-1-like [Patiria miniata]
MYGTEKNRDDLDVDTVADGIQRRVQQRRLGRADVSHRYHRVLKGMAAELSEEALEYIRSLDEVEYVSEDGVAHAMGQPWGLDRIDQRDLPLDQSYKTFSEFKQGAGVEIWVLDTGIRPTHKEFGGRASIELDTYGEDGTDCNGHGTHCAGIAAGSFYGVAKKASIKSIKVLGPCDSNGGYSRIIKGFDHVLKNAKKPAVVSMSIGGTKSWSMEQAVKKVVWDGIPVVVAAGNSNKKACDTSPAYLGEVITVGATRSNDQRASYSNYGECVDIFAPGSQIPSAYWKSDTSVKTMGGTSMACPHVAGLSALYLAQNPGLKPAGVKFKLRKDATKDKISDVKTGSPNLLTHVQPN